jgi:hypothetical protein
LQSTREAIRFLNQEYGIDEATAYAYLSAATDFEVSQVPGVIQNSAFSAKGCFSSLPGILSLPALSKVNFSEVQVQLRIILFRLKVHYSIRVIVISRKAMGKWH